MATVTVTAPVSAKLPEPDRTADAEIELQPTVVSRRPQTGRSIGSGSSKKEQPQPQAGRTSESGPPGSAPPPGEAEDVGPPTPYLYLKLLGCGFSFFFSGVNDGTLGPLVPYIQNTFSIGTGEIAIIYTTSFAGWLLAAILNPFLSDQVRHVTLGRVLVLGAMLQILSQVLRSIPFPQQNLGLYAVSFFVQTFGMALQDAYSNTFVSGVAAQAHRWLGFIHASYAAGLLVGPPVATAIASRGAAGISATSSGPDLGHDWTQTYFVLLGLGVVNLFSVATGFRDTIWRKKKTTTTVPGTDETAAGNEAGEKPKSGGTRASVRDAKEVLKLKTFWMLSLSFFFMLGWSVTAGGWVVDYLVKVRDGDLSKVGYVPTGVNAGLMLGRILLAEPTYRLGEKRMVLGYTIAMAGLHFVFWLVPNIIADATALSIMSFFFGPFIATGISVGSKLLPRKIRASGLSFVFVVAQAGGALFPSITGLIAMRAGVQVLQPIALALLVAGAIAWWLVPKPPEKTEES